MLLMKTSSNPGQVFFLCDKMISASMLSPSFLWLWTLVSIASCRHDAKLQMLRVIPPCNFCAFSESFFGHSISSRTRAEMENFICSLAWKRTIGRIRGENMINVLAPQPVVGRELWAGLLNPVSGAAT